MYGCCIKNNEVMLEVGGGGDKLQEESGCTDRNELCVGWKGMELITWRCLGGAHKGGGRRGHQG